MLHRYAVFELAGGAIVRTVGLKFVGPSSPAQRAEKAARQARHGQAVLELPQGFDGDDTTHRVIDGALVPITGD